MSDEIKNIDQQIVELKKKKQELLTQDKEVFQWDKLGSGFNFLNPIWWSKALTDSFKVLIVFGIIFGLIFAFGYYRGVKGKPVRVDLGYEEAVEIQVPNSDLRLYKPKNSDRLYWIDKDGNKIDVKVADIPSLKKALKPYGIVFEPYAIGGVGFGEKGTEAELGAGVYFLKYYLARFGLHLTQKGIYVGIGYKLSGLGLNNTAINLSYGKGYSGDERILFGLTINF